MVDYRCGYARESVAFPITVMGIFMVASFGLWLYFLANSGTRNPNTRKLQSTAKITRLGGIVTSMYFFAILLFFISGIIDVYDCGHAYTRGIAYALQFFGYNLLLVLFFYRFIKTFENSPYAVSTTLITTLKMIVFLPFLFVVCITATTYLNIFPLSTLAVFGIFYILSTLVASILILTSFIKKLNIVIQDFVKQFGTISAPQLNKLNQSVRYVIFLQ